LPWMAVWSTPATEETGAMGREIESRQVIGGSFKNLIPWRDSNPGLLFLRWMRCTLCHAARATVSTLTKLRLSKHAVFCSCRPLRDLQVQRVRRRLQRRLLPQLLPQDLPQLRALAAGKADRIQPDLPRCRRTLTGGYCRKCFEKMGSMLWFCQYLHRINWISILILHVNYSYLGRKG
jgi:hypothetical protein